MMCRKFEKKVSTSLVHWNYITKAGARLPAQSTAASMRRGETYEYTSEVHEQGTA